MTHSGFVSSDYLGHRPVLADAVLLVPAAHDQHDPLEAGLSLRAEHFVGGLELGVTFDHGPTQAVSRSNDVAPTKYKPSGQRDKVLHHNFNCL